jgi:hypothetical protein
VGRLQAERQCDGFTPWRPGFTPKEHRQMQLDQLIRDEAAKRERQQREWQEERTLEDRRHREEREDAHRRFDKLWSLFVGILLAVVGGLVGYIFGTHK